MTTRYKIESANPDDKYEGWYIYVWAGWPMFKSWQCVGHCQTEEDARARVSEIATVRPKRIFLDEYGKEDLSW